MALNKLQREQIKGIMQQPGWEALIVFTGLMINKWNDEEVKASDEFNTIWNMAHKTGKINGIKEYFDILDREALS